jgi:hypothetical protein
MNLRSKVTTTYCLSFIWRHDLVKLNHADLMNYVSTWPMHRHRLADS